MGNITFNVDNAIAKPTELVPHPIVEAKAWKMKPDGTVVLVAEHNPELLIPWLDSHSCN